MSTLLGAEIKPVFDRLVAAKDGNENAKRANIR
jgi:hypothetical protein